MRTLLFLFIGLLMLFGWFVSKHLDARRLRRSNPPESDAAQQETSLARQLDGAASTFEAAAKSLGDNQGVLRSAVVDLSTQCSRLAIREESAKPFTRTERAAIVRLVLALYGVVERATTLAKRRSSREGDALLSDATDLIRNATNALGEFVERADESALTHLEVDLDVLRDRLTAMN